MKLTQLFEQADQVSFVLFLEVKSHENDIQMSFERYNIEDANIKNITADDLESVIESVLNQLPVVDIDNVLHINVARNNSAAKTYRGVPSHLYKNILFYHGDSSADTLLNIVKIGDTYSILKHPNFINMGVQLNYINDFKLTDSDIDSLKLEVI